MLICKYKLTEMGLNSMLKYVFAMNIPHIVPKNLLSQFSLAKVQSFRIVLDIFVARVSQSKCPTRNCSLMHEHISKIMLWCEMSSCENFIFSRKGV